MATEKITINLTPDYCCGGGHCGPLPGYFFVCPHCNRDSKCRTGYPLSVNESLKCRFCKSEIKAVNQIAEFQFEFQYDSAAYDA
jgi:hypothetical protein